MEFTADTAREAFERTGAKLLARGRVELIDVVVAGGTAGLWGGLLSPSRTTADCDVLWSGDAGTWALLASAAVEVADAMGLPRNWLNRDCSMFLWCLPLGWRDRCELVGEFGALRVHRLGRIDLIASKVMGSPKRPHDLDDLKAIGPTRAECEFVREHLDRLAREDVGGREFEEQRAIVQALEGEA